MKRQPIYIVVFLVLLLGSDSAIGQDLTAQPKKARTREDYKLRTLREIAAEGAELVSAAGGETGEANTRVQGDLLPSRARVNYKGSARPVSQTRKDVIAQWAQRYAGNPDHYIAPYTSEVLFPKPAWTTGWSSSRPLLPRLGEI